MKKHGGWPTGKGISSWFDEHHGGIRKERVTKLRLGWALDERYAAGIVGMLLAGAARTPPTSSGKVFMNYLEKHRVPTDEISIGRVLNTVCNPSEEREHNPSGIDFLQWGEDAISEVFRTRRTVDRAVQACADESDVREAVDWMFVCAGRQLLPVGAESSIAEARASAERSIGVPLAVYQERAIEWWSVSPWTVIRARGSVRPAGMMIALPITREAYDALLGGTMTTCECRAAHLCFPSDLVLLEGVAERPFDMGSESDNGTRSLFIAVLSQLAALARPSVTESFRVLSFAPTKLAQKRLAAFGLRPIGKFMGLGEAQFMELVFPPIPVRPRNLLLKAAVVMLSAVMDHPPT